MYQLRTTCIARHEVAFYIVARRVTCYVLLCVRYHVPRTFCKLKLKKRSYHYHFIYVYFKDFSLLSSLEKRILNDWTNKF